MQNVSNMKEKELQAISMVYAQGLCCVNALYGANI